MSVYIRKHENNFHVIITLMLYFAVTSEGGSINPYCRDRHCFVIYFWRASRVLDTVRTTAEEIHVQKHLLMV